MGPTRPSRALRGLSLAAAVGQYSCADSGGGGQSRRAREEGGEREREGEMQEAEKEESMK